jgi:hypothetical protein
MTADHDCSPASLPWAINPQTEELVRDFRKRLDIDLAERQRCGGMTLR